MRVSLKRVSGAMAALLAVGLLATGCQQTPGGGSGGGSGGNASAVELPSTAWTRASADAVADGGTLTLAVTKMPDNWNPAQADGALAALRDVLIPMGFDQYLRADEAGKVRLNPDYLVSAELKSTDPQMVEVKLNPNAKWQDGSPITVDDLIAYQKALSGANEAYQVASKVGWQDIASIVKTTDDFTAEITYSKKNADWIIYTYPELPASISNDPEVFNTGYVAKPWPSKGPFRVASVDQTAGVISLERNPLWWGATPKLGQLIFRVVTQANEPQSFANGEIDTMNDITTGDSYQTAKGRQDAMVQTTNGVTWTHVTLNATRGALTDAAVRQAIALTINREVIGQTAVGPLEAPVSLVSNGVFLPGQDGYEDSYLGKLTHDPEQAAQILADAGYQKGSDGVYEKAGQRLEFAITVPSETKSNADRAAQIQKDLNANGFKVEIATVPVENYFKDYVNRKNFDMVTFSWQGTLFPIQSAGNLFYPIDSEQNYTGYANPKVGELNQAAQAEFDREKRIAKANELSTAMLGDYTIIPFYATPKVVAVKDTVVNYGASQFETPDWTIVGFKK